MNGKNNNKNMNNSTMVGQNNLQEGGEGSASFFGPFFDAIKYANHHVMYLNNSKFFAGIVMILLNIGSKFITIQFSQSTEEYMKYTITKQIMVFAMAWMGTRDIYTALGLTAIFTILSEYLFNEESSLCIVPQQYRVLEKLLDTNNDGAVSETELAAAISVLEKAKKEKQRQMQKEAFTKFEYEKM